MCSGGLNVFWTDFPVCYAVVRILVLSPRRMTVRDASSKEYPASLVTTSSVPVPVTGNGALMERVTSSLEAVKVWRATAPVTGVPFRVSWTVRVEGMVVPASIMTVPVKNA